MSVRPLWLQKLHDRLTVNATEGGGEYHLMTTIVTAQFLAECSQQGKKVYSLVRNGMIEDRGEQLRKVLNTYGEELCHLIAKEDEGKKFQDSILIAHDDLVIDAHPYGDNWFSITLSTTNQDIVTKLHKELDGLLTTRQKRTTWAITASGRGPKLSSIGHGGLPLVRENYSAKVLEAYDHIIEDLKSDDPSGRLAIIDGPAGTGKTHLVRGLLSELEDHTFVILPPDLVAELAGPNMLPLMIEIKESKDFDGPIIFVIEDADNILVPRADQPMSQLSGLLNYTDGIFGSLFDMRIIATTNAKHMEFEPALVRPGRLSRQITVGNLSAEEATKVLRRITKDDTATMGGGTLAQIYAEAKGWKVQFVEKKENKVGFN